MAKIRADSDAYWLVVVCSRLPTPAAMMLLVSQGCLAGLGAGVRVLVGRNSSV